MAGRLSLAVMLEALNYFLTFRSTTKRIVIAVGIVVFIVATVPEFSRDLSEYESFLQYFSTRMLLPIMAEAFSVFFVSLYKTSLSDMKHLQNELTNVELKLAALYAAIARDDKKSFRRALFQLSKTERNFILKRGEIAATSEDNKFDKKWIAELPDLISKIFRKPSQTSR